MLYLVDDAADYRFLVQQVFKMFLPQYSLRLFADGLELMQHVEEKSLALSVMSTEPDPVGPDPSRTGHGRPGLIVLDVDMPRLNGLQTLERLKQNSYWQTIPVVIMSNRIEAGFKETAYQLGANSYMTKPMDLAVMKDVMGQLCREWIAA